MSNLEFKVTSRTSGSDTVWEGTVSVPGLRPTKLVRRSDNSTTFATRSAATNAARTWARNNGYTDIVEASTTRAAAKKASIKATTVISNS